MSSNCLSASRTVLLDILASRQQHAKLLTTVEAFNQGVDYVYQQRLSHNINNVYEIQRLCYQNLRRNYHLSSQMAVHAINKSRHDQPSITDPTSPNSTIISMPYDRLMMSFKGASYVSLLTLSGRTITKIHFVSYTEPRTSYKSSQSLLWYDKSLKKFELEYTPPQA